jgi:hypothetical protein
MEIRNVILVLCLVFCIGCGGSGGLGESGGEPLTADECRQIMLKIDEITDPEGEIPSTPGELEEAVTDCVEERIFDREDLECIREATTDAELTLCLYG